MEIVIVRSNFQEKKNGKTCERQFQPLHGIIKRIIERIKKLYLQCLQDAIFDY